MVIDAEERSRRRGGGHGQGQRRPGLRLREHLGLQCNACLLVHKHLVSFRFISLRILNLLELSKLYDLIDSGPVVTVVDSDELVKHTS
jgi:hypothetical protein